MDNKQMMDHIRRLYEDVYSKGKINVCDELCTADLKFHDPSATSYKVGVSSLKESENAYHKAFPNKKSKIEDICISGDKVIVRWSCQGKHNGELQGISPTHRSFNITGMSMYLFSNGKISEIWQAWDRLSLLEQLGAIQPAHASN